MPCMLRLYKVHKDLSCKHASISTVLLRGSCLYTFNAQCPQARWPALRAQLQQAADSFTVHEPVGGRGIP